MYSFDASSMIHAWDNYPPENPHFDSLWQWFSKQIDNKNFGISSIALEQVSDKILECGKWLQNNNIEIKKSSPAILKKALVIKNLLGIVEEKYHPKGVDENDLIIIATAKENKEILVSDEGRQSNPPLLKSKYKIPAVCKLPEVNIICINFLDLLKSDPFKK